jgi:hypothetical protein
VGSGSSIRAEIRRGYLRQIAAGAKSTASTLGEALLAVQGQIFTSNFQRGRLLVSTSGSGQSGSFEISMQGREFTQSNVFAMIEEFLEILSDTLINGLAVDSGVGSDTDNLFLVMCEDDRLRGVKTRGADVTLIGTPQWTRGNL